MSARWVEDAEGRHWNVGVPEVVKNESMSNLQRDGLISRENVCVTMVITLRCTLQAGQPIPDSAATVGRVTRALTLGGSQGLRSCPAETAATGD